MISAQFDSIEEAEKEIKKRKKSLQSEYRDKKLTIIPVIEIEAKY